MSVVTYGLELTWPITNPYLPLGELKAQAAADLRATLTLCGEMFGLGVIRHRYFELDGWTMPPPAHKPHRGRVRGYRHGHWFDGPYLAVYGEGGGKGTVTEWQEAMGIDWTDNRKSIAEAIPPAYTEHIGHHLAAHLNERRTVA